MTSTRKVSELKLWSKNPRSIKEKDFKRLKKQIQELGQYKPLLITKENEVIGGNMRLRAYQDLGIDEVWVSVVDPKNEAEKLKYALSDNDRAGYYDDDLLANMSSDYPDFEWGDYAVDLNAPTTLDDILKDEVIEDEPPEVEQGETKSKLGEVYQLGRHRLMCGDATKIEDVEKLMDGKKVDMVFTSPPYNTGNANADAQYYSKNRKTFYLNNKTDDMTPEDYYDMCISVLCNIKLCVSKVHSVLWNVSYSANAREDYGRIIFGADNPFRVRETIIWDKGSAINIAAKGILGRICELIFLMSMSDKYLTQQTRTDCWWNVWRISAANIQSQWISACFPVVLAKEAIERFSTVESLVLDIFGGSGSTLIACEQLDRTCYMMELDPHYCDVIRKRYENFKEAN